jgi:hypothetical protein
VAASKEASTFKGIDCELDCKSFLPEFAAGADKPNHFLAAGIPVRRRKNLS